MRIDTPEKYKALQERRKKAKKRTTLSDRMESYITGFSEYDREAEKEAPIGYMPAPHQIGHRMKPNHEARAMDKGFAPLMTRPVVPGWFRRS